MKKKIIVLVTLLSAAVFAAGCGKKETSSSNTSSSNAESKEHVYKIEDIKFEGIDVNNLYNTFFLEDSIVLVGSKWEEQKAPAEETEETGETTEEEGSSQEAADEGATTLPAIQPRAEAAAAADTLEKYDEEYEETISIRKDFIAVHDYEGKQISYVEEIVEEDGWKNQYAIAPDGSALYYILNEYFEDNSDPDNYIWEENYYLVKKSLDGTEEWKIDLAEYSEAEYTYVNNLVCSSKGKIVVNMDSGILVFEENNLVKQISSPEENNIGSIFPMEDGRLLLVCWGEQNQHLKTLDVETGEISEAFNLPANSYNYSYYAGVGFDLLLTDSVALFGYNIGDEGLTEVMNFVDSDMSATSISNITGKDISEFYGSYYSFDGESEYAKFTKVAPEDVQDKQVLSLACIYIDYDVRKQVVNFNKTNDKYRITIEDYSSYNTETDYNQAQTKLNTDIISGKIPDILLVNSSLPVESYISKGLFEDFNTYLEKDEDISREDLMENVLEVFSTDGKLYQIVPYYSVMSIVGKSSIVGTEPGWTLDELEAVMANQPEGTYSFFDTIRETVLRYSIVMGSEQFIDWDNGECSFNTEGFTKLLEFIKQFPEEYDQSLYENDEFWSMYDSMYRENKAILNIVNFSSFGDYNRTEKATFGEEINAIGFPAENRKGSAIDYSLNFAMSSKSENKEGAWEFIKYFLSYDYQKESAYGFPINKQRFEELKKEAQEPPYYIDEETGEKVETENIYWIGDQEITIPPMTAEEVQKVEDFILSIDQKVVYDENLINIIMEETASYFDGQKSAQEVADIIQSRTKIYINESR